MPNRILISALLLLIALAGFAASAFAAPTRISGELELRYGSHTATENGVEVLDAGHFTQKYSILAEKEGLLSNGRLGRYRLNLGYEWAWVDAEKGLGQKVRIDNPLDNLLYRGEIKLAPGGLPFKLSAYSYDNHSMTFVTDELGELFNRHGFTVPGETVSDVRNGSNRITGLTFFAGTKNGRYEGKYRDTLSTLPLLLIDFRQTDVHNVKVANPIDYTDRDLAFVSLNKKSNWLHYKVFTHEDRIDDSNNYREQSFLLGTIDHNEYRQWVHLANWIEVSSDISYSETVTNRGVSRILDQKRYDLNVFAKARRTRWQGSSFSSYSRVTDGDSLDRTLILPFNANGELNRDTAWRFNLIGRRTQEDLLGGVKDGQTDDMYASARIETFRRARYLFTPSAAAESKQGMDGEGYALKLGAEFRNNSRYRSDYDVFGSYEARRFTGTGETGRDVDYFEQVLEAGIGKDLSSQLRGTFSQNFMLGNGSYDSSVADQISAQTDSIINYKGFHRGSVFRSLTSFVADHRSQRKVNNRLELSFEYQSGPLVDGLQTQIDHRLDYIHGAWRVSLNNRYGFGDEIADSTISLGSGVDTFFLSTSDIGYRPSRVVEASLRSRYENRSYVTGMDTETYKLLQSAQYSLWNMSGLRRKLAVFGEEVEFVKNLQDAETVGEDYLAFTLFTDYYPLRSTLLSAKLRYEIDGNEGSEYLIAFLSAGVDFQKLKLSLDYSYGDRTEGDFLASRTEHRWEMKVTKLF